MNHTLTAEHFRESPISSLARAIAVSVSSLAGGAGATDTAPIRPKDPRKTRADEPGQQCAAPAATGHKILFNGSG